MCVRPPVQGSPAALPSLAAVPLHTTTQVVAQWSSLLTDGALPEVHTAWLEASTAHVCTTVGVFWLKGKPKASGANVASSAVTAHAKSLVAALGGPSFVPATKGHLGFKLASSVKPIEHLGSRIEFKPAGLNYHSWYYMNIPSTPDDAEGMAAEAKVIRVFLSRGKKAAGDSRAGMPMTLAVKGREAVDAQALAALQAAFKAGGGDKQGYIFEAAAAEVQPVPAQRPADNAEGRAALPAARLNTPARLTTPASKTPASKGKAKVRCSVHSARPAVVSTAALSAAVVVIGAAHHRWSAGQAGCPPGQRGSSGKHWQALG